MLRCACSLLSQIISRESILNPLADAFLLLGLKSNGGSSVRRYSLIVSGVALERERQRATVFKC